MKYLKVATVLAVALISGCDTSKYSEERFDYPLTPGMEGCRHFVVGRHNGGEQSIWRCPNSTTTSSQGKFPPTVVTD